MNQHTLKRTEKERLEHQFQKEIKSIRRELDEYYQRSLETIEKLMKDSSKREIPDKN